MKKCFSKLFLSVSISLIFISCATTSQKKEPAQKSSPSKMESTKENPEEKLFLEAIKNIKINFVSTPKQVTLAKKAVTFATPYTVKVTNADETPAANFSLTYQYPAARENGEIVFATQTAVTGEDGTFSFIPEKLDFPCSSSIIFYPTPLEASEKCQQAAKEKSVSAEWKVRSAMINTGALLFVWEFNEKNRPTRNSYTLLSQLKAKGVWNIGNAPINEITDLDKSLKTLYRENYEIVENAYGYLICGTVKFTKPVEATEAGDGYLCSLVAEISAVDMKNGNVVYTGSFVHEATGTNWNTSTSKCKEELSKIIADSLIYGL